MKFAKPALSLPDQLAKLRSRGLVIADEPAALHCRLHDLINHYPSLPLSGMGFPPDWTRNPFWNFPHTP